MSYNLPDFPAQKLFNIYDGPAHQVRNAYLDITISKIADCSSKPDGSCKTSAVPLAWNFGVLQATDKSCYLPNAAIGWKQPNGFYYPPAFHSNKLWFQNVDIRHFVIEPLFDPITPAEYDPFVQNQTKVNGRYCTHSIDMFSKNFNNIDRQTVLNDDDGTLTGASGGLEGQGQRRRERQAERYDFGEPGGFQRTGRDGGMPVEHRRHRELSLPGEQSLAEDADPAGAKTSPYDYVTTVVFPECGIGPLPKSSKEIQRKCKDDNYNGGWRHRASRISSAGVETGPRNARTRPAMACRSIASS